jgi:hypothetical protein
MRVEQYNQTEPRRPITGLIIIYSRQTDRPLVEVAQPVRLGDLKSAFSFLIRGSGAEIWQFFHIKPLCIIRKYKGILNILK